MTAYVGLAFLSGGYAAPIAAAAREYGGPAPLPTLELLQLAFPVFDPDGKADSVADKHDAADAGPPERRRSGRRSRDGRRRRRR